MQYSEDFKARVRRVFPEWSRMHEFLESGSQMVGRYLNDSQKRFTGQEIMNILENAGGTVTLADAARKAIEIDKLYAEWCELS